MIKEIEICETYEELANHALWLACRPNIDSSVRKQRFATFRLMLAMYQQAYAKSYIDDSQGQLVIKHQAGVFRRMSGEGRVFVTTRYYHPANPDIQFERLLWWWQVLTPESGESAEYTGALEECLAYVATYATAG